MISNRYGIAFDRGLQGVWAGKPLRGLPGSAGRNQTRVTSTRTWPRDIESRSQQSSATGGHRGAAGHAPGGRPEGYLVRLNRRCDLGAVAPGDAGRSRVRVGRGPRLDGVSYLVVHAGGAGVGDKAGSWDGSLSRSWRCRRGSSSDVSVRSSGWGRLVRRGRVIQADSIL